MEISEISVQLFTVREALQADIQGTLRRLSEMGFERVEPFEISDHPGLADALCKLSMAAPTVHSDVLGDDVRRVFETAVDLGSKLVVHPYTEPDLWCEEGSIRRLGDSLMAASEVASEYGLRVGYHNHDHEIAASFDSGCGLDVLAAHVGGHIDFEIDTYWVLVGGADPVDVIERLGDTVKALHLKDGPVSLNDKEQTSLGQGKLPLARILASAPEALLVLENDDCAGDRFDTLDASLRYLIERAWS